MKGCGQKGVEKELSHHQTHTPYTITHTQYPSSGHHDTVSIPEAVWEELCKPLTEAYVVTLRLHLEENMGMET